MRPLILAAGNGAGQVCIWSVTTGQLLASLADTGPPVSGKARAQRDADAKAAAGDPAARIVGLDWVTADPNLIAVLSASGWLTVWDWGGRVLGRGEGGKGLYISAEGLLCAASMEPARSGPYIGHAHDAGHASY